MSSLYLAFATTVRIVEKPGQARKTLGKNDSCLLFGEEFAAAQEKGGWIYGTSASDGYKGWVPKDSLKKKKGDPTHFTDVPLTHIYPAPSFKTPPVLALSFLSRLTLDGGKKENGFVRAPGLGWIFAQHIKPLRDMTGADPVETALLFLNAPYLYGGRSAAGIDCSGLVQLAAMRGGLSPCPRDSGDQQAALGKAVTGGAPKRGDLVFFPGHVGIMTDGKNILNATARHMRVVIEPLRDVEAANKKILAVRRLRP